MGAGWWAQALGRSSFQPGNPGNDRLKPYYVLCLVEALRDQSPNLADVEVARSAEVPRHTRACLVSLIASWGTTVAYHALCSKEREGWLASW